MKNWVDRLAEQTQEQVIEQCRIDHPTWSEIVVQMWCLGKKQLDGNIFSTTNTVRKNWQKTSRSIKCPVLLVTADPEKGGIITPEVGEMITAMNPNIRVAHIPGAGHHIRFENHAAYMDTVRAFLRGL